MSAGADGGGVHVLHTPRLLLRPAGPGDVPALARFVADNREHLAPFFPGAGPAVLDAAFWEARVEENRREAERGEAVRLLVLARDAPGAVLGMVDLTAIVRGLTHSCSLGYGVAAEAQGRGIAAEAVGAAVEHAFGPLGLHRVAATYAAHNHRSGALLKRLGFTVEGYARDYLYVDGRWEDHVLAARLNPAWRPWREQR
ncbi:MAG TPA: GNAT family N-acetyltransferase [Longimicrobiaceae bacterium]